VYKPHAEILLCRRDRGPQRVHLGLVTRVLASLGSPMGDVDALSTMAEALLLLLLHRNEA
jgi:hypothetical protein